MLFPRPGHPGSETRKPVVAHAPVAFFPFHHVNAYEEEALPVGHRNGQGATVASTRVVIDTVGWDEVDFEMEKFITEPVSVARIKMGSSHQGNGSVDHYDIAIWRMVVMTFMME